jgi:hypothetical protein
LELKIRLGIEFGVILKNPLITNWASQEAANNPGDGGDGSSEQKEFLSPQLSAAK